MIWKCHKQEMLLLCENIVRESMKLKFTGYEDIGKR